jgi:hypothetical protein
VANLKRKLFSFSTPYLLHSNVYDSGLYCIVELLCHSLLGKTVLYSFPACHILEISLKVFTNKEAASAARWPIVYNRWSMPNRVGSTYGLNIRLYLWVRKSSCPPLVDSVRARSSCTCTCRYVPVFIYISIVVRTPKLHTALIACVRFFSEATSPSSDAATSK